MPVKKRHISDFMLTCLRVVAGFCALVLFSLGLSATAAHAVHEVQGFSLTGTPIQGGTLTVTGTNLTSGHPGEIPVYSWRYFTGAPLSETSNTYQLTQADVGRFLIVSVSTGDQTRSLGTLDEIVNSNLRPTGTVPITGNLSENETLGVNLSGLRDDDGLPNRSTFSYQWSRSDAGTNLVSISGATGRTYTLTQSDVGNHITLTISYTDRENRQETYRTTTSGQIANVNVPPTGLPAISGTRTEGRTLTAITDAIEDRDGLENAVFTYQWNTRIGSTDTPISGATQRTYIPTQADVGRMVTVTVRYTDDENSAEGPLTSAPTTVFAQQQTTRALSATVTPLSITPGDGPVEMFPDLTVIGTIPNLVQIRVLNRGDLVNEDAVTTPFVRLHDPVVPGFNFQASPTNITSDSRVFTSFAQEPPSQNAEAWQTLLRSVAFQAPADTGGRKIQLRVEASYDNGSSYLNMLSRTLNIVGPAPNNPPTSSGLAVSTPEDTPYTFEADDFPFTDADTGDRLQRVSINDLPARGTLTLGGGAVLAGQVINVTAIPTLVYTPPENANGDDIFTYSVYDGTTFSTATTMATITINPVNDPPTGAVTIDGMPAQNQTLTAVTDAIVEPDGLENAVFTYQWNTRVGSTDTPISNATSETYTLTQGDVGEMITVTVRYTDAGGEDEGPLTSAPTEAVANVNDPPVGTAITLPVPSVTGGAETVDLNSIFTDPDGDALIYTASSGDESVLRVSVTDSTLTLIPVTRGTATLTLRANDRNGGNGELRIVATVGNSPPIIPEIVLPVFTSFSGEQGPFELSDIPRGVDPDGDITTYTVVSDDLNIAEGMIDASHPLYRLFVTPFDIGNANLTITANDGNGGTDTRVVAVQVLGFNRSPVRTMVVPMVPELSLPAGPQEVELSGTYTDPDGDDDALTYQAVFFDTEDPNPDFEEEDVVTWAVTGSTLTLTPVGPGTLRLGIRALDSRLPPGRAGGLILPVTVINSPVSGNVIIDGVPERDQTLTADTSGISDADGPDPLPFTYQWNRNNGTTSEPIPGANEETYTLTDDDVGNSISVTVDYTDRGGTDEGPLTSTLTAQVIGTVAVSIAPPDAPVDEGEDATFTVTLSHSTANDIVLNYATSVAPEDTAEQSDFMATSSTLTFSPGAALSQTFTVSVEDDELVEGDETFTATLSANSASPLPVGVSLATATAQATIAANGTATVSVISGGNTVPEDQDITFAVQLSGAPGSDVVVNYTASVEAGDTAMASDFTETTGTLTFPAGTSELSQTFTVGVVNDNLPEDNETFTVTLSENPDNPLPAGFTLDMDMQTARGTIAASDEATISLAGPRDPVIEGENAVFTVTLSASPVGDGLTVGFSTSIESDDTAQANDFTETSGAQTFFMGTNALTQTIVVPVTDDNEVENSETFTLTLMNDGDGGSVFPPGFILNPSASSAKAAIVGRNNAPTTVGLGALIDEDTSHTFVADDFNFTDADMSDMLEQVRIDSLPATGDLTLNGTAVNAMQEITVTDIDNGSLVYTPADNVNGASTFDFSLSDGTDFSESAVATILIRAVNDEPSGTVTISGTARVGETLMANTGGISDVDGPDPLTFTYQWNTHSGGVDTAISGANSATYTPTTGDEGEMITVTARFTDDGGMRESLTSAPTAAVAMMSPPPPLPDLSGTTTPLPVTPGGDAVVVFPDLVVSDADANPVVIRVRVENPDDLNAGDTLAFSGTPNTSGIQVQFFPAAGIIGTSNDTLFGGFASGTPPGADRWQGLLRNLTFAAPAGSGGREIRLFVQVRYSLSGSDSSDTLTRTLNIGAPAANSPPTGLPTITGTPRVGVTLTANTSGISDADGPDPLPFTYQWNTHAGGTDTAINNATSATYLLTADEMGDQITVSVRYTDAGNTNEGPLTSVPTAAVAMMSPLELSGTTTPLPVTPGGAPVAIFPDLSIDTGRPNTFRLRVESAANLNSGDAVTLAAAAERRNYDILFIPIASVGASQNIIVGVSTPDNDDEAPERWHNLLRHFTFQAPAGSGGREVRFIAELTVSDLVSGNDVVETLTRTLTISAPANTPPTTSGLTVTTLEDTAYTFAAGNFNFNDADSGDNLVEVRIDSLPASAGGSLALSGTAVIAGQVIPVAGIPNLRYTPALNVNGAATFTFSVSDGTDFSTPPATATVTVNAVNDDPSGTVTITGTATVGETLTANTDGISDADGPDMLSFTYQWLAGGIPINNATSPTYLLTGDELGEMISVDISYMDANDIEGGVVSDPVGPVLAADMVTVSIAGPGASVDEGDPATFTVTLSGSPADEVVVNYATSDETATEGSDFTAPAADAALTFAANTTTLTQDINIATTDDSDTEGDETFTLTLSAPSGGFPAGVTLGTTTAQATIAASDAPANTPPTSTTDLAVTGLTVTSGAQTFDLEDNFDDADSSDTLTYTADSGNETIFTVAVAGSMLTITPVSRGTATLTLTADDGNGGTISQTPSVTVNNSRPTARAGSDSTADKGSLITLDGSGSSDPDASDMLTYLWTQQPGSTPVTLSDPTAEQPTFTIPTVIERGFTFVFRLVVSDGALSSTNRAEVTIFTRPIFPFPTTLDDQTYVVGNQIDDLTLPTALDIFGNPNTYALSPLPPGLSFNTTNRTLSGTPTQAGTFDLTYTATSNFGTDSRSFSIAVINLPTITGTPTEGEELTADASAIIAANGLDESDISYQWQADGVDIANATSITYTLSTDDIGKRITVTASFTVGATSEERTSAPTAAVAAPGNIPATGEPTISGILQVGQTLTADTSGIVDADGPAAPAFSYQWQADGQDIAGATAITYIPTAGDVGDVITVTAIFTDDVGTREERTSAPTAVIQTNTRPTANAGSGSTGAKGSLITLDGSGSNDPDGDNANLTYLWTQVPLDNGGGIPVTLSDPTAQQPTFTIPTVIEREFTFRFNLVVNDGALSSTNTARVEIFTRPRFGFPETLVDQTYVVGNQIDDLTLPTALDTVGNPNTYALSPLPPGLSFNTTNRTLSGTPTQSGTFDLTYVATSSIGTDSRSFSIAVVDPVTVSIAPPGAAVDEGDPATFTVTLSGSPTDEVVVDYATSPDTAVAADFTDTDGTLTFAAGATDLSQDISVPTTDDSETEGDETFTLTLSANTNSPLPAGVTLDTTTAQATIAASDAPVNNPPTTSAFTVTTNEDTDYTFAVANFPFADTDTGDMLEQVRIDSLPDGADGNLTLNNTAVIVAQEIAVADIPNLVYTPVTNVNGTDSFTFSVSDGTAFSATPATATVTINSVNDDPSGEVTISGIPRVGETLTANTAGITDADGPATLSFTYQWLAGNTPISNSDSPTYILTGNELGEMISVDVSYMDADGFEGGFVSDPVGPVVAASTPNTPPTSSDLAVTIDEDTPHTFAVADFPFSDVDTSDSLQQVSIDRLPTTGSLTLGGASVRAGQEIAVASIPNLFYTPVANANGTDTFTYRVSDGTAFSAVATATITINAVNDDPTGTGLTVPGLSLAGGAQTVDLNSVFSDPDGDTLSYEAESDDEDIVTVAVAGSMLTITPVGAGTATLTLRANDGNGGTVEQTVMATVGNSAPTTSGLAVTTDEDAEYTFAVVDFPFTDADGDNLQQVRIDSLPASGSLTLGGTAVNEGQEIAVANIPTLVYTPVVNANGDVTFDFSVSDGTDFSESSTAVLTIEASNDPATGLPTITGTANEGEELTADVSGIEDIDGLPELSMFTYQWNTRVGSTDTPINNATTETYTPTEDEVGEFITVTVFFTDGGGTRESLTSESTMEVTDIVRVLTMDEALRLNAEPPTTDTTGSIITLSTSEEVILDNANGEDFTVTSTLNGETVPHEVTGIRAGSIVLEVTPAIGFGSLIGVSYNPVQGSITGAVTGNPVVPFSISVNNAVRPLNEDLDREGRKTLLTHLAGVQSDLVISTVQNHLRALDGGNRVSVPRHAGVETEGEGKYVEYENVREMLSHLEFDLSLNSLMGLNEEWRKIGISSAGAEGSLAPVVGTDLSSPRTLTLWGGGGETRLDNDYNTSGDDNRYDGRVWSYNTGLDYRPSESLTLGAAVGYLDSELTTTYNEGTYDEKMVSVSPYLLYESPWGLDISLFGGYGIGDVDLTGTFGQASTPFAASADSNLLFGAVRVSGAMKFLDNSLEVVPNVSLLGSRKRLEGYTDSSNREIGETTASVLRLTPGFEVSYRVKFSGVTLRPFASGGLIFDLLDTVNDDDMTYSVGGGMRFETEVGLSGSVEGQRELGREAVEQRRFVGALSYGIAVGRNGRAGTVTPSVGINHASGDDVSAEGLSQAYVLEYTTRGGGHSISFEHDRSEEEGARSGLGYRYGAEIMPGLNLEATVSSPNVEKREVKGFVGMKLRF